MSRFATSIEIDKIIAEKEVIISLDDKKLHVC